MLQSLHAFTEWVANTPLSLLIQNVSWVIPAFQSVHILAICVVMGSVALIDLRLLGVTGRSQSISSMVNRLVPAVWVALVILFLSGSVLAIGEPVRSLENPAFHAKMLMLLCVGALTFFFQHMLRGDVAFWELSPARRATAKLAAVVSLLLWVGIIFAGRWIAYTEAGFGN
ncbi:MAG: hypothetical protein B7Y99_08690 [Caulobacterales bacterium 32-69-10]|nr:MAG: hypothetical protein B7Y99_08690 [Caulobacterales bacterium 32-69-10]